MIEALIKCLNYALSSCPVKGHYQQKASRLLHLLVPLLLLQLILLKTVDSAPPSKGPSRQPPQQSGHYRRRDAAFTSFIDIEREKQSHYVRTQFIEKLFHSYDRRVLPNLEGPTTVNCSLFINNFDSISEVTMDYAVGVYLRQAWIDPRLKFDPIQNNNETMVTLDAKSFDKLWVPDLFFTNEKRASFHSITVPNRLIRLNPAGYVLYSVRLSLTLSCVMDLRKFPLDSQVCTMMIESYAYTTDKIILQWRSEPLEVSNDLMIPQFSLRNFDFADCSKRYATGNFSCLKASFYLDRDVGYYIIQTYLPSVLVVVLSWVAFWIDPTAVPARVTFGVFTTLILSTMSSSVRSTLPRVSYVKAIDVWMSVCMFFVFTALIEYAIVNVVLRQKPKKSLRPAKQLDAPPSPSAGASHSRTPMHEPISPASSRLMSSHGEEQGETIHYPSVSSHHNNDDRNKPYFRGSAAGKQSPPKVGLYPDRTNGNNPPSTPEIWIPLEVQIVPVEQGDSSRVVDRVPPSSLLLQQPRPGGSSLEPASGHLPSSQQQSSSQQDEQLHVDHVEDIVMARGPSHLLDIAYYWHRTMIRLSEMEGKEKGQMVENWARKIFPLSFGIFNVVYWIVYLYYI